MIFALVGALSSSAPARGCDAFPPTVGASVRANDNRSRAGSLRDGVHTVNLVARTATWRPDGRGGCALTVHAFAEEGRQSQIPGPLIRVRIGTRVRVNVRNELPNAVWVRGLQDRGAETVESVKVEAGKSREFRFVPNAPGAWYYWAGDSAARVPSSDANGQLVGALIVDRPVGIGAAVANVRIMVLTRWTPRETRGNNGFQLNALNGLSWPNTERLAYVVGDSVRWHVINATNEIHEMHLHGFYFRVESRGFMMRDSTSGGLSSKPMLVTGALRPGEWQSIAWSPDRAGNWLYHCHLLTHMSSAQRLDRMTTGTSAEMTRHGETGKGSAATDDHMMDDMAGLVIGINVRPRQTSGTAATATAPSAPARTLDLFADMRLRVFGDRKGYGFVVREGAQVPAADSIRIPGTPLILTKGEPVRITVHNRIDAPMSVHWHGIELDSYYDGVGGFSGMGKRIAGMIAPHDSFVVRFTPPRAGTFIYHTHGERGEELSSGLYAPLLVLEPGATFDSTTDRVFTLADGGPGTDVPVFVNGTVTPDTMEMVVGATYRLRIITISANDSFVSTMRGPGGLATWRVVARDGYPLPSADAAVVSPARYVAGPGHTREHAFTPTAAGDYAFSVVRTIGGQTLGPSTTVAIRVRAQ
ncbi:MAG: multicopper oxidase domain-containing protein [bacterium]